jgi:hypothetical protein
MTEAATQEVKIVKAVSIRTFAGALLVALCLFASLPLSAATPAPKEPEAKPVVVTYFFLPG